VLDEVDELGEQLIGDRAGIECALAREAIEDDGARSR
jgi:hypothetical protein